MPIYAYTCNSCDRASEILVAHMVDRDQQVCPYCGSADLRRAVSSFMYHRSQADRISELESLKPDELARDDRYVGLRSKHRLQQAQKAGAAASGLLSDKKVDEVIERSRAEVRAKLSDA